MHFTSWNNMTYGVVTLYLTLIVYYCPVSVFGKLVNIIHYVRYLRPYYNVINEGIVERHHI